MRITSSLFYANSIADYQRNLQALDKTNKQIASGLKIQDSYEDSGVFTDTMRLNYEIATLEQAKESSQKAQTFANNTDQLLNQFGTSLDRFKSKLIQAANEVNSNTSLNAIADELRGIKEHLVSLANTSINGQYILSGSSLSVKPISADGTYNGNSEQMKAIIGSGVQLPYNIDGASLFLGSDSDYNKKVSTNVKMFNQSKLYPDTMSGTQEIPTEVYLNENDTIRDMIGDTDSDSTNDPIPVFYLSGRKPDGVTFSTQIKLATSDKVSDLLKEIGLQYGNTATNEVAHVSINDHGQIEVVDLKEGNNLLQMHLFAAVDRTANNAVGDAVPVPASLNTLASSSVDIIAFDKSDFANDTTPVTVPDAMNYDRKGFSINGNELLGNVSQIVANPSKDSVQSVNDYAVASTKLIEVAGKSLDGETLIIKSSGIKYTLNLFNSGSTFTDNPSLPNKYKILDPSENATKADKMTYQQLLDVVSMITSNNLPSDSNSDSSIDRDEYFTAVQNAQNSVETYLDDKGRVALKDLKNPTTKIELFMYDKNADDPTKGSALTFMSNDAITIDEPRIDFFADIQGMIDAVASGQYRADAGTGDPRNIGIQNSIARIDHIADHITREHTRIGAYSNALGSARDRVELLSVNVQTIRSEVSEVDMGEALIRFNQISNSYQAMLSTVAKINSMTLLNYI